MFTIRSHSHTILILICLQKTRCRAGERGVHSLGISKLLRSQFLVPRWMELLLLAQWIPADARTKASYESHALCINKQITEIKNIENDFKTQLNVQPRTSMHFHSHSHRDAVVGHVCSTFFRSYLFSMDFTSCFGLYSFREFGFLKDCTRGYFKVCDFLEKCYE